MVSSNEIKEKDKDLESVFVHVKVNVVIVFNEVKLLEENHDGLKEGSI